MDRLPPFSAEAELAVLGGMMMDGDAFARAVSALRAEHFHREGNRRIFRAMVRIAERGDVIDFVTLPEELRSAGDLESAGGMAFLSQLIDAVPHAGNLEYHAGIVRDHWTRRQVVQAGQEIAELGRDVSRPAAELVAAAEGVALALGATTPQGGFLAVRELLGGRLERLEEQEARECEVTGVASGFEELDAMLAGFQPADYIVIAGRPSMGKTSFFLDCLAHAGITLKMVCAFFSLEMSKEAIVDALLCSEARVDSSRFRRARLFEDDRARLATAFTLLNSARILIDDEAGITIAELRARARRLKADHPELGMVGVDYLQLVRGTKDGANREQEIAEVNRGLKALAKELNVPVVGLSQLSRAVESRPDKRPMMSDLRESGSTEQDADVVMFLYRPEYYYGPTDKDGNSLEGRAELIVGKQRKGATGTIPLHFHKEYTRFESVRWSPVLSAAAREVERENPYTKGYR